MKNFCMYDFGYFPGVRTPGKCPKEYIQYSKHGESLKSRRHEEVPHKVCNSHGISPSRPCLFRCFPDVGCRFNYARYNDGFLSLQTVVDMLHSSVFNTEHFVLYTKFFITALRKALHCTALCFAITELQQIKLY